MGWWPCGGCNSCPNLCSGFDSTITLTVPAGTNDTACSNCASVAGTYVMSFYSYTASSPYACEWQWDGGYQNDCGLVEIAWLQFTEYDFTLQLTTRANVPPDRTWVLELTGSNSTISPALGSSPYDCSRSFTITTDVTVYLTGLGGVACTWPSGTDFTLG